MKQPTQVGHIEINASKFTAKVDFDCLPVLPTRNLVVFPGIVFPINLVRESSRAIAQAADEQEVAIAIVCQEDPQVETPGLTDLKPLGVIAQVLKVLPLPDGSALAVVRAGQKIGIEGEADGSVIAGAIHVKATPMKEPRLRADEKIRTVIKECSNLIRSISEHQSGPGPGVNAQVAADGTMPPEMEINNMCCQAPLPTAERYQLLQCDSARARAMALLTMLDLRSQAQPIINEMEQRAKQKLSEHARRQFLETQLGEIRSELYGDMADDATGFREALERLTLDSDTAKQISKEIDKLERLSPQSPDYQVQYSYIKTILELPWGKYSEQNADFAQAQQVLDHDHSGMEKVKERVLEHLAMQMHSPESHSPILCLVGPPGVGKTSLGQSIARALGRRFQRVSLGGLHDESEIRGHRRTYIGAMPGRIVEGIRRAGSMNPVIMLDEIDKVGADYKGDPAAALLEVLDPEQNCKFHDNYIDLDMDLSKVMFITTANSLSTISAPLLDRMEIIEVSGYATEEKRSIALEHLLPTLRREMNIEEEVEILPETIDAIVTDYTMESGVRRLQKQLAAILRKYVMAKMSGNFFVRPVRPEHLRSLLGIPRVSRDKYGTDGQPGVVTGLAWTAAGGEVLFIECVLTDGKGDGLLSLTGNLGDVMKESAQLALRYVKAHAADLSISAEQGKKDLHIHVPEGAIPKDGPSAGITMTTAIVSALTGRPVRPNVAMTGEMTLRGKVLPVGGIKEKILAAKRAGIKEIIMCEANRVNVEEIDPQYVEGIEFHYVQTIDEVLKCALGC